MLTEERYYIFSLLLSTFLSIISSHQHLFLLIRFFFSIVSLNNIFFSQNLMIAKTNCGLFGKESKSVEHFPLKTAPNIFNRVHVRGACWIFNTLNCLSFERLSNQSSPMWPGVIVHGHEPGTNCTSKWTNSSVDNLISISKSGQRSVPNNIQLHRAIITYSSLH